MKNIDILYLGVNMGNAGYRFFCRYPEAKEDYYETFKWLVKFKKKHPETRISIKHHPGDYSNDRDKIENSIIKDSGIIYLKNKLDSYRLAETSKMCVSYCSTMILELSGYPNLAHYIYDTRHHRISIKKSCRGMEFPRRPLYVPSFYLDPHGRNRQFCRFIDDVCKHNCEGCYGAMMEIFEPYRILSYNEFEKRALSCISEM